MGAPNWPQVAHKLGFRQISLRCPGSRRLMGVTGELKIRAVGASRCRQCRGCMWVGRSGGVRRGSTTTSDRGCERRRTQQARQRAGARRYVRCFPGFESPCSSAREHPGKSSPDSTSPSTARVFMHHVRMSTHATSPSACPCVACALISAHIHIQRQPTSKSTQRERCVGVCRCCARRHGITALVPPAGVCWGAQPALFSQAAPKCAPIHRRECRSVQRAWHHPARPPRRLG